MVNTPSQAVDTFLRTKIDILAIGDYIITKKIILIITHDKKTFKKTRKVYLEQHKTFFKNNELFDRFYSYAVEPKNYFN